MIRELILSSVSDPKQPDTLEILNLPEGENEMDFVLRVKYITSETAINSGQDIVAMYPDGDLIAFSTPHELPETQCGFIPHPLLN